MNIATVAGELAESLEATEPSEQERAFTAFCETEYRPLVGTLTLLLADRWQAEDLAQEALARAWLRWRRVSSLERPDLWTRRVAVNLAHSAWRKRKLTIQARQVLSSSSSADADQGSPNAILYEALAGLTPRQRTALTLRFFADMSVADTAAVMHCQEGTVKALTSQGIARLRTTMRLDQEGRDD